MYTALQSVHCIGQQLSTRSLLTPPVLGAQAGRTHCYTLGFRNTPHVKHCLIEHNFVWKLHISVLIINNVQI